MDSPMLKLHIIEGMDQFAAEGQESTVKELYVDWLKKVEKLQKETQETFITGKQLRKAEETLATAGFEGVRLS